MFVHPDHQVLGLCAVRYAGVPRIIDMPGSPDALPPGYGTARSGPERPDPRVARRVGQYRAGGVRARCP